MPESEVIHHVWSDAPLSRVMTAVCGAAVHSTEWKRWREQKREVTCPRCLIELTTLDEEPLDA